jgi:hypothetical protein
MLNIGVISQELSRICLAQVIYHLGIETILISTTNDRFHHYLHCTSLAPVDMAGH